MKKKPSDIRIPKSAWTVVREAAEEFARTFPYGSEPRGNIFRALNRARNARSTTRKS